MTTEWVLYRFGLTSRWVQHVINLFGVLFFYNVKFELMTIANTFLQTQKVILK